MKLKEKFEKLKPQIKESAEKFIYHCETFVGERSYKTRIYCEDEFGINSLVDYISNAYNEDFELKVNNNVCIWEFEYLLKGEQIFRIGSTPTDDFYEDINELFDLVMDRIKTFVENNREFKITISKPNKPNDVGGYGVLDFEKWTLIHFEYNSSNENLKDVLYEFRKSLPATFDSGGNFWELDWSFKHR